MTLRRLLFCLVCVFVVPVARTADARAAPDHAWPNLMSNTTGAES